MTNPWEQGADWWKGTQEVDQDVFNRWRQWLTTNLAEVARQGRKIDVNDLEKEWNDFCKYNVMVFQKDLPHSKEQLQLVREWCNENKERAVEQAKELLGVDPEAPSVEELGQMFKFEALKLAAQLIRKGFHQEAQQLQSIIVEIGK